MKVLRPSQLMRDAADVLAPVYDSVVVIGATAIEAALAGHDARSTATTDVDCAVEPDAAERVIDRLESEGLVRSELPQEAAFTWVREGLKVQLIRPPTRTASPRVQRLVDNTYLSLATRYRDSIAFVESPDVMRLWAARASALVALSATPSAEPDRTPGSSNATITMCSCCWRTSDRRSRRSTAEPMTASCAAWFARLSRNSRNRAQKRLSSTRRRSSRLVQRHSRR